LTQFFPSLRAAVVAEDTKAGKELLELHFPIQQHARRNDLRQPKSRRMRYEAPEG
jgi:hypothetical protein